MQDGEPTVRRGGRGFPLLPGTLKQRSPWLPWDPRKPGSARTERTSFTMLSSSATTTPRHWVYGGRARSKPKPGRNTSPSPFLSSTWEYEMDGLLKSMMRVLHTVATNYDGLEALPTSPSMHYKFMTVTCSCMETRDPIQPLGFTGRCIPVEGWHAYAVLVVAGCSSPAAGWRTATCRIFNRAPRIPFAKSTS